MSREMRASIIAASERGTLASKASPDRWVYAQALRDAGHSLEEIGRALGVTRERVRQKTNVAAGVMNVDAALLMRTLRDPATHNLQTVFRTLKCSPATVKAVLGAMCLWDASQRLFRWRKRYPMRVRHATLIRELFGRHGRTPTLDELSEAAGVKNYATQLIYAFGSIQRAMEYAGIPHRSRYRADHTWRPGAPLSVRNASLSASDPLLSVQEAKQRDCN